MDKDINIINLLNNLLTTLRKNIFDEEENIIIGGDFNCTLNPILDKKGSLSTSFPGSLILTRDPGNEVGSL